MSFDLPRIWLLLSSKACADCLSWLEEVFGDESTSLLIRLEMKSRLPWSPLLFPLSASFSSTLPLLV